MCLRFMCAEVTYDDVWPLSVRVSACLCPLMVPRELYCSLVISPELQPIFSTLSVPAPDDQKGTKNPEIALVSIKGGRVSIRCPRRLICI